MPIVANQISKYFGTPPIFALSDITLTINDGDFACLSGKSGAGKSTLLYILSSLDQPTEGGVLIDEIDLRTADSDSLHKLRNVRVGFVFQFHYLIEELTVLQNVLLPTLKFSQNRERMERAYSLLRDFSLEGKAHRYPRQLSGGEQQRVALARSLIMEPKYLFADEPTGSLDTVNGEQVMSILKTYNQRDGMTIIMVTHDPDFAKMADYEINLRDGRLVSSG